MASCRSAESLLYFNEEGSYFKPGINLLLSHQVVVLDAPFVKQI